MKSIINKGNPQYFNTELGKILVKGFSEITFLEDKIYEAVSKREAFKFYVDNGTFIVSATKQEALIKQETAKADKELEDIKASEERKEACEKEAVENTFKRIKDRKEKEKITIDTLSK